jgi:hypothetical protein
MGDGDTPDPPIGGGDEDDSKESDDDATPATLDEFTSENEETNGGSGAGAAATAAGAGAAAGATGAGAAAGAGGVGGSSGTSGTDDTTGDEPGTDTPDGTDGGQTADPEPAEPEEPDTDTDPGSEDDDPQDDDPGQDQESNHRDESPDDQDLEDPDDDGDLDEEDEADDSEDEENEDEDDEDDDDDEKEEKAVITQYSDAWDNVGFGLSPVYYPLEAEYGDEIDLQYRPVPVREFDDPDAVVDRWEEMAPRHGMPTETAVWQGNPPTSTILSNRALAAAHPQGQAVVAKYLRRLRIAAIVEGRNIEDKETLFEIAAEAGVDTDQLENAWDQVEVRTSRRSVTTPTTQIEVDGETIELEGLCHVNDIKMMLDRAGLQADPLPDVDEFVAEYGPVALQEIVQVCGFGSIDEAKQAVQESDSIEPVQFGDVNFWNSD